MANLKHIFLTISNLSNRYLVKITGNFLVKLFCEDNDFQVMNCTNLPHSWGWLSHYLCKLLHVHRDNFNLRVTITTNKIRSLVGTFLMNPILAFGVSYPLLILRRVVLWFSTNKAEVFSSELLPTVVVVSFSRLFPFLTMESSRRNKNFTSCLTFWHFLSLFSCQLIFDEHVS